MVILKHNPSLKIFFFLSQVVIMSLGEIDLLSMDNSDLDFANWIKSREYERPSLESQLEKLQQLLGENVFTELQDEKVIVYYRPEVTFEIVLNGNGNGKNMVYQLEETKDLVYSITPLGFSYQQLVSCWMDFQRNRLESVLDRQDKKNL